MDSGTEKGKVRKILLIQYAGGERRAKGTVNRFGVARANEVCLDSCEWKRKQSLEPICTATTATRLPVRVVRYYRRPRPVHASPPGVSLVEGRAGKPRGNLGRLGRKPLAALLGLLLARPCSRIPRRVAVARLSLALVRVPAVCVPGLRRGVRRLVRLGLGGGRLGLGQRRGLSLGLGGPGRAPFRVVSMLPFVPLVIPIPSLRSLAVVLLPLVLLASRVDLEAQGQGLGLGLHLRHGLPVVHQALLGRAGGVLPRRRMAWLQLLALRARPGPGPARSRAKPGGRRGGGHLVGPGGCGGGAWLPWPRPGARWGPAAVLLRHGGCGHGPVLVL